mgnify:CR=1 FL=1
MNVQARGAEYIKRLGIKQAEVSRKTDIKPKRLSGIMNCSLKMTADEYEKICKAIEKEPNDFMEVG